MCHVAYLEGIFQVYDTYYLPFGRFCSFIVLHCASVFKQN